MVREELVLAEHCWKRFSLQSTDLGYAQNTPLKLTTDNPLHPRKMWVESYGDPHPLLLTYVPSPE
jgi:hypothetical protein